MGKRFSLHRKQAFDIQDFERRQRKKFNAWLREMKEKVEESESESISEFRERFPELFERLSKLGFVPEIEKEIKKARYRKMEDVELVRLAHELLQNEENRLDVEKLVSKDPALYLVLQERELLDVLKNPSPLEISTSRRRREMKREQATKRRQAAGREYRTRKDAWAEMSDEALLNEALDFLRARRITTMTKFREVDNYFYDVLRYRGLTKKLMKELSEEA